MLCGPGTGAIELFGFFMFKTKINPFTQCNDIHNNNDLIRYVCGIDHFLPTRTVSNDLVLP